MRTDENIIRKEEWTSIVPTLKSRNVISHESRFDRVIMSIVEI